MTQVRCTWLTSGIGRGRGGEPNGFFNNIYFNHCERACELNPKEYLLGYNDINIITNDIINDFIDNYTTDKTSISTIKYEEYEREKECYIFEPLIYNLG